MPGFEIAWNRRRLVSRDQRENAPWVKDAILLERVLLEGEAQLKVVCRVASVIEDRLSDPAQRDRFWHIASARLSRLHRLSPRDRNTIEAQLANTVPKPVPVTQAAE